MKHGGRKILSQCHANQQKPSLTKVKKKRKEKKRIFFTLLIFSFDIMQPAKIKSDQGKNNQKKQQPAIQFSFLSRYFCKPAKGKTGQGKGTLVLFSPCCCIVATRKSFALRRVAV